METLTFAQDALPRDLKAQVLGILEHAWPTGRTVESRIDRPLHDPRNAPVSMLLVDGDAVLSYLVVMTKPVEHAGVQYRVSGIGSVATHPDRLRRGHAGALVSSARDWIAASGVDLAVFTCDIPLARFYADHGWTVMPDTVVVGGTRERPFRADESGKVTLMAFFSDLAIARRSDFEHADLHLDLREGDLW